MLAYPHRRYNNNHKVLAYCESGESKYCVETTVVLYSRYKANVERNGKYLCRGCSVLEKHGCDGIVAVRYKDKEKKGGAGKSKKTKKKKGNKE